MSQLHFDIWPDDDYEGTALGELTDAFDKQIRDADQAIGQGQFRINRHSAQAAWCVPRALVRVRRVTGGPFAFDDSRYFFAFFLESSADVVLSTEEEGGEVLSRGGESVITFLKRAVIYPGAEIVGHRSYWRQGRTQGVVVFTNKTVGEALRILILNAKQRAPDPIEGLTVTWTDVNDSTGTPWPETTTDWRFTVGTDLLTVLGQLVSSQSYFRITPDMVMSAYDEHPGDDLSATITFAKGVDLIETAERSIDARGVISRALVRGAVSGDRIQYFQAIDASWETDIGRIEGFVEYTTTANQARLVKRGLEAVRKSRLQHDGPTTSGVLESAGKIPYTDYFPGDLVTLDIPGVYDTEVVRVSAIVLTDTDAGEYDVTLEFNDAPWDPASGPGGFGPLVDAIPSGCDDCPPTAPSPFVPGDAAVIDVELSIGSAGLGGGDRIIHYASQVGASLPTAVPGNEYRLLFDQTSSFESPINGYNFMSGANLDTWETAEGPGHAGSWTPSVFAYTADAPFTSGKHWETPWAEWIGSAVALDISIGGTMISGFYGGLWAGRLRLEMRSPTGGGEDDPLDPVQGQPIIEPVGSDGTDAPGSPTDYPYAPLSLVILVNGVDMAAALTETDPTAGTYELLNPVPLGAEVTRRYLATGGEAL